MENLTFYFEGNIVRKSKQFILKDIKFYKMTQWKKNKPFLMPIFIVSILS